VIKVVRQPLYLGTLPRYLSDSAREKLWALQNEVKIEKSGPNLAIMSLPWAGSKIFIEFYRALSPGDDEKLGKEMRRKIKEIVPEFISSEDCPV
jgi:hypothetical protein